MSSVTPTKPGQGQGQSGARPTSNPGQHSPVGTSVDKAADKAKEAASGFGERVQDAASYIGEKAKAATSSVMHGAEDAASYVGHKADDGMHAVGSSLKSAAGSVRDAAPSGMMKNAASCVADSLESTGKYLEAEGFSGIAEDMTALIKRNPIPALFVGVGIGFLLARALTPRN